MVSLSSLAAVGTAPVGLDEKVSQRRVWTSQVPADALESVQQVWLRASEGRVCRGVFSLSHTRTLTWLQHRYTRNVFLLSDCLDCFRVALL